MTDRVCVYHSGDLDGICSAAIVRRKHPDVELIPWNYGQEIPWRRLEKKEVWLVDLTWKPKDMVFLLEGVTDLHWVDHHADAIKQAWNAFDEEERCKIKGARSSHVSAAFMTWLYCFPDWEEPPDIVADVSLWDTWQWKKYENPEEIEAIQFYLRSLSLTPESDDWTILFGVLRTNVLYRDFVRAGQHMVRYQRSQNELAAKKIFVTHLGDWPVVALNSPNVSSVVFDSIRDRYPEINIFLSFNWVDGHWICSLRSDGNFDVSALAREYGGNGHPGAAGFECDELPFELR